ncbi:MAG: hypothetical protein IJQ73_11425 [Kiritimatiellae bacterium]|nr:hypothetical protein [Kiritimatiellia bacterium]
MKHFNLYNTAHPMAEGGRPIFVPFGEWPYDRARRQRLDRAHGEAIANELNARVARGEPGIPVYQGHPDVPELAARYPDKGAVGWVTRIDLANEGGRDGLALKVEWDRDPGRGFRWFSPYWTASAAPDGVCAVEAILSVGLVNNPNIPDFRLANEKDLNQTPAEQAPTKEHTMDIEAIKKALGLPRKRRRSRSWPPSRPARRRSRNSPPSARRPKPPKPRRARRRARGTRRRRSSRTSAPRGAPCSSTRRSPRGASASPAAPRGRRGSATTSPRDPSPSPTRSP